MCMQTDQPPLQKVGDIITARNGTSINSRPDLPQASQLATPGTITLLRLQGNRLQTIETDFIPLHRRLRHPPPVRITLQPLYPRKRVAFLQIALINIDVCDCVCDFLQNPYASAKDKAVTIWFVTA